MIESKSSMATTSSRIDLPQKKSDVYHTALVRAFIFQVAFALLASLMLDGGIFRRFFGGASVLFWVVALVILLRRPGAWGIWYLRHGVLIVFAICFVAGMILPYDTLLDLVTH